jgi:predicted HTH transcriptional regulator
MSLDSLLLRAYRDGVECSLEELRSFTEFSGLGLLQSIQAIDEKIKNEGLALHPPVEQGEFDQKRVLSKAETSESFTEAARLALQEDESLKVEFKESLYLKKKVFGSSQVSKEYWVSEEICFDVIATICSFLNGEGGTLLIGVADDGTVKGIDCEFEFIPGSKKNPDGWELFLSNCLEKFIFDYKQCIGYVQRKLIQIDGLTVCVVIVKKRTHSLAVCQSPNERDSEKVYVRNGNGKAELKARAIEHLIRSRFEQ